MFEENHQKNNAITLNFETRYKEGKIDQMVMKIGAVVTVENENTLEKTLNKTVKHLLLRIKYMFSAVPMKIGTTMVVFDDFMTKVIKKLEDNND